MNLDDAITDALRFDARMTVSELAKRVKTSRAAISARMDQLRADGSLTVVAAVHPEFLGLTAFAHLAIRVSGRTSLIAERTAAMPAAAFVSAVSGQYQLIVELRLPGRAELYGAIAEIRAFPGVERVNTLMYVDVVKGTFMPGRPLPVFLEVDEKDLAIIDLLRVNGRKSYATLADAVGLSPSATRKRVVSLIASELVRIAPALRRTRPDAGVIAGIGLNVRGNGKSTIDMLAAEPRVEYLARTIGRYEILATVAAHTPGELDDFLSQLTASTEIAYAESWVHLRVMKERYEWPLPTPEVAHARSHATTREDFLQ